MRPVPLRVSVSACVRANHHPVGAPPAARAPRSAMRHVVPILAIIFAIVPASSRAQLVRGAVSVDGLDTNPCTVAQPCRTFAAAMAATKVNGEVVALTSGGYSPFTITKSIKVFAPEGIHAAISPTTGSAIVVDVASTSVATDEVVIEGLSLNGMGATYGVRVAGGRVIVISRVTADRFAQSGIGGTFTATNVFGGSVFVVGCAIRANLYGISIVPAATTPLLSLAVEGTQLLRNSVGLNLPSKIVATFHDSVAAYSSTAGIDIYAATGETSTVDVSDSVIAHNVLGIRAGGSGGTSKVRVSDSMLVFNRTTGLDKLAGAQVLSRLNNTVENNTAVFDGSFAAN